MYFSKDGWERKVPILSDSFIPFSQHYTIKSRMEHAELYRYVLSCSRTFAFVSCGSLGREIAQSLYCKQATVWPSDLHSKSLLL